MDLCLTIKHHYYYYYYNGQASPLTGACVNTRVEAHTHLEEHAPKSAIMLVWCNCTWTDCTFACCDV